MASKNSPTPLELKLSAAEKTAYIAQQALLAAHAAVIKERLRKAFPQYTTAVFSRTDDEDFVTLDLLLTNPDSHDDDARGELDFRGNPSLLEETLPDDTARAVNKINDALIDFGTSHENLETHFPYVEDDEGQFYKFVLEFHAEPVARS